MLINVLVAGTECYSCNPHKSNEYCAKADNNETAIVDFKNGLGCFVVEGKK